jgi:hypothetical protein
MVNIGTHFPGFWAQLTMPFRVEHHLLYSFILFELNNLLHRAPGKRERENKKPATNSIVGKDQAWGFSMQNITRRCLP